MLQPLKHVRRGKRFWSQGEPLIWATGAALTAILLATALLLGVVLVNGLGTFWPSRVALVQLADGRRVLGQWLRTAENTDTKITSVQLKTGNREIDPAREDFHWYKLDDVRRTTYPAEVFVLERLENGNFYGFFQDLQLRGSALRQLPAAGQDPQSRLQAAIRAVRRQQQSELGPLAARLAPLTYQIHSLELAEAGAEHRRKLLAAQGESTWPQRDSLKVAIDDIKRRRAVLQKESEDLSRRQQERKRAIDEHLALFTDASGQRIKIPLVSIVRFTNPNSMGWFAKAGYYLERIRELVCDPPRESNTEGGLFPAIFGTVMLVFLMALASFPLGVLAGVYLGEYAKEGFLVRLVRVGVNNLAGIPSIVYGMFGLGFFIYFLGQRIDAWLFPGLQVFSTGGILWASLTLGLLTIPVVIVSTEEALRTIPRGIREGSYALGATKFQTLLRVLVPIASPGIMTGFILAMARAAGEVAPLMITGVIKSAPDLPLDGRFPFFHVERKFEHLGFHIYDVGFQSPNAEACKPMVYVTTLLLLLIVLSLSSLAIYLRNRMKKRYQVRTM
jgi:phosphate transport system permease protein